MKRVTLLAAAALGSISSALSGAGINVVSEAGPPNENGLPQKKRFQSTPSINRRRRRNHMPHYGAKEQMKVYATFTNPHTGHSTIGRIA